MSQRTLSVFSNFEKLCRTCLNEKSNNELRPLFEDSLEINLYDITSIRYTENDGYPKQLCNACYDILVVAKEFRELCRKSDHQLRSINFSEKTIISHSIPVLSDDREDSVHTNEQIKPENVNTDTKTDCEPSSVIRTDIFTDENEDDNSNLGNCTIMPYEAKRINIKSGTINTSITKLEQFNVFNCQVCESKFKSDILLRIHSVRKHNIYPICTICGQEFNALKYYNIHIKTHHKNHRPFKCNVCQKTFRLSTHLAKHRRTHGGEKKHLCQICGKSFFEQNHLVIHTRSHTGEKPKACNICGKRFSDTHGLTTHQKVHTGEKNYECDICGNRFAHSFVLKRHKRVHTGEKPYKCSVCSAAFASSSYLKIHTRTHTKERPFTCLNCNKSFISKCALRAHTKTHTGEKKYQCATCGKRAGRAADLRMHMRTHTGEKPYGCDQCTKRFHTSSNLMAHKRTHSSIKNHVCTVCGRAFGDARTLASHNRTHTGEKPYVCRLCGNKYTQSGQLAAHRKIHVSGTC